MFFGIRLRVCCIASCASMSRPAATSASPRLSDSRLCCKSVSDRRDACHRWKRSSMAIPASSIRECSRTNFRKASTSSSTVLMDRILQFVPAQIKLNYIVPRHPANPREVVGIDGGFTQSHRALGRSLPACRDTGQRSGKRLHVSPGLDSLPNLLDCRRAHMLDRPVIITGVEWSFLIGVRQARGQRWRKTSRNQRD